MYPISPTEKLIETKTCRRCQISFPITNKDVEFYDKIAPVFHGKKYGIPAPALCPDCRQQRRLSFRNERKLYKRRSDLGGNDMVSMYSPDKVLKIYSPREWQSDVWDPMNYGRDFDFSRPFFEQFLALFHEIPHPSLMNPLPDSLENSEYNNYVSQAKNSYLNFGNDFLDNTHYSSASIKLQNCLDIWWSNDLQWSHECVNCGGLYESMFSADSGSSSYLLFCQECDGCTHCFLCYGLKNKQYHILNIPYSKEEYFDKIKSISFAQKDVLKSRLVALMSTSVNPSIHMYAAERCTGDYMYNSGDCHGSYNVSEMRNVSYVYEWGRTSNVWDGSYVYDGEWNVLEGMEVMGSYRVGYSLNITQSSNILYSQELVSCQDCFWCIGLRNKSYCILNKQYTREEYETLVPKIIEHMTKTGEWWEFFPSSLSPFWYNETVAQEYYPLDRSSVIPAQAGISSGTSSEQKSWDPRSGSGMTAQGWSFLRWPIFNWSDYEPPFPKVEKIIPASKLPQDITQIPDDILNWAIECEVTKKPFRIIKQELEFYRKHNLPIPKRHPDQRHLDRMAQRNPRKLFERKCDCCHKDMITTYALERPERVYCEECYRKEVNG